MDCRFRGAVASRVLVALLVAAGMAGAGVPCLAQDDFADVLKSLRTQKSALRRDIGSGVFSSGRFDSNDQRTKLQQYFGTTLRMMQVPGNEGEITKDRLTMFRELRSLGNASSRDAYNVAVQYLVAELPKLINDDKQGMHVRYNAMLMLGSLNAQEAPNVGLGQATPLPATFGTLMTAYQDDQLPMALRVGALIGLHRHASLGITEKASRDALRAAMLKAYTEAQTPTNVSQQAHVWIKMRAVEILGYLRTTGSTPDSADVVAAIVGVINDSNSDLLLRAESARALQSMDFNVPGGLNTPLIAKSLAQLVMDTFADSPDRQKLKHVLHCVRLGLTGPDPNPRLQIPSNPASVSKVGPPEARQMMAKLASELEALSKQIDNSSDVSTVTGEKIAAWLQENPVDNQQLTARN